MNGVKLKVKTSRQQSVKENIQRKQQPTRVYPHRGYCKQRKDYFSCLEFLVNTLGCAIVIGVIWYLIKLIWKN